MTWPVVALCLALLLWILRGFGRWLADAPKRKALREWHEAKAYDKQPEGRIEYLKVGGTSIPVRVKEVNGGVEIGPAENVAQFHKSTSKPPSAA